MVKFSSAAFVSLFIIVTVFAAPVRRSVLVKGPSMSQKGIGRVVHKPIAQNKARVVDYSISKDQRLKLINKPPVPPPRMPELSTPLRGITSFMMRSQES
ncbi:hypothetical protein CPB83DRAFT_861062 [Crepidotus variabilis]|uniref:Uncharacterized protein n=1 Tax=Crepidotus variabilis TaxID=179855 RepID=A0A9P6JL49_9AGAR|nr:hypothetical protein CPB83DRAFT_861062 [Crepidotus variabilis]